LAPDRAEIALKAAKAQHARGRFAESETWAATTLKLDPGSAEAFAIIARAERRAGHAPEATAAYRKYLALAPRGWHAREARRALRLDGEGSGTRGASSGEPGTAPLPERSTEPVRDSSARPVPPTVSQAE
jgi:predicted Zn-dependent protease